MIRFWNPQLGRSLRLLRLRLSSKIFEGIVCLDVLIQRACPRITRSRTAIPHNSASEQIRGSHFLSCRGLLKCSQAWKIHYRFKVAYRSISRPITRSHSIDDRPFRNPSNVVPVSKRSTAKNSTLLQITLRT